MNRRPFDFRRLALVAATAGFLVLPPDAAAPDTPVETFDGFEPETRVMALEREDHQYLRFGEATFDFYRDRKFDALSKVLVGREQGLFGEDTSHAELLLGDLYVSYGLTDRAEEIFTRLLDRDILAQTRAETWFHTAALHYRQGEPDRTVEILDSERMDALAEELADQRRLMAANAHIYLENFDEAVRHLDRVEGGTLAAAYANYNMGVAMIRADHIDRGLEVLETVINMGGNDGEIRALRDRAALTVGLTELRRGDPERARTVLRRVRSDGPFSNEAMMILGLANYYRGEPRQALPLWLELVQRNPGHESVQEALILAPRAYEELGAKPQAMAGYQFAAERYREELRRVEVAIRNIDEPGWLKSLLPDEGPEAVNQDPMALMASHGIARGEEMAYLHQLFASHTFSERFRQYQQVLRLRQLLEQKRDEIPALREVHAHRQHQLERALPGVRENLVEVSERRRQLRSAARELEAAVPRELDMSRPEDLAALPQAIMLERVREMEHEMERGGATPGQRERLRRVRGLLLWDIAHNAEETRTWQEQTSENLVERTGIAEMRVAAVEELVREGSLALQEAEHADNGIDTRLLRQQERVDEMLESADVALEQLGQILKNDAFRVLAEIRRRLGEQLGEVHLSMARIQEGDPDEEIPDIGERTGIEMPE